MGVRILEGLCVTDNDQVAAVLYCSTSGVAFGPLFESQSDAEAFLDWLDVDPRSLSDKQLAALFSNWLDTRGG